VEALIALILSTATQCRGYNILTIEILVGAKISTLGAPV
jgi:hypothetical protein